MRTVEEKVLPPASGFILPPSLEEQPSPSPTKRIFVGGGMSFVVPRALHEEAQRQAHQHRRLWFLGLTKDSCLIGPDRESLLAQGCHSIAWVLPGDASL